MKISLHIIPFQSRIHTVKPLGGQKSFMNLNYARKKGKLSSLDFSPLPSERMISLRWLERLAPLPVPGPIIGEMFFICEVSFI